MAEAEEREVMRGYLGRESGFRLFVSGTLGVREIERLIEKLEIDKAILEEAKADDDMNPTIRQETTDG